MHGDCLTKRISCKRLHPLSATNDYAVPFFTSKTSCHSQVKWLQKSLGGIPGFGTKVEPLPGRSRLQKKRDSCGKRTNDPCPPDSHGGICYLLKKASFVGHTSCVSYW